MKKIVPASMFVLSVLVLNVASAASIPKQIASDGHIRVVQYDPNNVVMLDGQYGYQTQITFAPDEVVQNVSLGDSVAWQAVPIANHLFIKPVAASRTNMTILTNLNSYNFQLDSQRKNVTPTYRLQFIYPQKGWNAGNREAGFNPAKLNLKYSYTGDASLVPETVFDNGQFTYFRFRNDGLNHLPSVFLVDQHRNESLINYHMQGEYLVVNAVARQFTLRDGKTVASVYNDLVIANSKRA